MSDLTCILDKGQIIHISLPVPQISAHSAHLRMDSGAEYWDTIYKPFYTFNFFEKRGKGGACGFIYEPSGKNYVQVYLSGVLGHFLRTLQINSSY